MELDIVFSDLRMPGTNGLAIFGAGGERPELAGASSWSLAT